MSRLRSIALHLFLLTIAIIVGCDRGPSTMRLLPGPPGPPYLLLGERSEDKAGYHIEESCYGILYGGVEPDGEVCFHIMIHPDVEDAELWFNLGGRGLWVPLGSVPLGDEAKEYTSTRCTGAESNLQCEWTHVFSVRIGRTRLWIERSHHGYAETLAGAKSASNFSLESESARLQAAQIIASWY